MMLGFVSGVVSGLVLFLGSWALLLTKGPQMRRQEVVRDLRHYGRDVRKPGATRIKD